jgi:hypothetical protein
MKEAHGLTSVGFGFWHGLLWPRGYDRKTARR